MARFLNLFKIKGFFLFMICMMLMGVGISITVPFISLFSTEELGMSTGAFGIFMAISSLGGVFVNSFVAKRSDSGLDRKWLIIISMIFSAIGYLVYLYFQNYFILLILVTVFSGVGAISMPQVFAFAQESASKSKSDDIIFAMSTLRSLFSLGFLIGPLIGTILLNSLDYDGLFYSTALIFVLIAILVYFFLGNEKTTQSVQPTEQVVASKTYSLRDKIIALPFMAFIFLFAVNNINAINTPLFIVNTLDGTRTEVGLVASICAGLEIPVMIVLGALGKKISNLYLMIGSCFIGIVYYLVLTVATDAWQIIAAQVVQAIFVAIIMGNGLSYFAEILPHSPGVASTFYANATTIGRLVGTLSGGFLAELLGFRYTNLAVIFILILSFGTLWLTKKHRTKMAEENYADAI